LDSLGDSYPQALRRFLSLERKLTKHPGLRVKYAAFMKEYRDLGHMSPVPASEVSSCRYFLPHHCVMKENNTTTKLRVVFDGSAATSTGYSLNDAIKLLHILIWFRSHPVAIQELTDFTAWRYVPTALNPADILSRGSLPSELSESSLWAHGPAYLTEPERDWPTAVCPVKLVLELCEVCSS